MRALITLMAILAAYPAHAQVRRLNGTYIAAGDCGMRFSVDGVPWNDGDSITVMIGNREFSAFRATGKASFIYSGGGCIVSFTPQVITRKQAMRVESSGACSGENAMLAGINAIFVRPRDPWR